MGPEIFINLHKSIIMPNLEYCSPVWSPQTVTEIKNLEGVQRRARKHIHGTRSLTYEQRLTKMVFLLLSIEGCDKI